MKLYTIRDSVTEKFFARLFMFENDNHAIRIFWGGLSNPQDPMSQNPDDYTLYRVGAYDDDAGIPIGHDPVRVITGLECVKQYQDKIEKIGNLQEEIKRLNGSGVDHEEQPHA